MYGGRRCGAGVSPAPQLQGARESIAECLEASHNPFIGNFFRSSALSSIIRRYYFSLHFTTRGSTRPGPPRPEEILTVLGFYQ